MTRPAFANSPPRPASPSHARGSTRRNVSAVTCCSPTDRICRGGTPWPPHSFASRLNRKKGGHGVPPYNNAREDFPCRISKRQLLVTRRRKHHCQSGLKR